MPVKIPAVKKSDSLYAKLGGKFSREAIVDESCKRLLAEPELASFFTQPDIAGLKSRQVQFFTQVTGEPAVYQGQPMGPDHEHLPTEGQQLRPARQTSCGCVAVPARTQEPDRRGDLPGCTSEGSNRKWILEKRGKAATRSN